MEKVLDVIKLINKKEEKKCEYTRFQITLIDSNDIMI